MTTEKDLEVYIKLSKDRISIKDNSHSYQKALVVNSSERNTRNCIIINAMKIAGTFL